MRLYEYEAKAILAEHGVPIPRGWLWPDLSDELPDRVVVKAQVLGGGRGKAGGIVFVNPSDAAEGTGGLLEAVARDLLGRQIGEQTVGTLYVEEAIPIERELYAAALVDRDRRRAVLLAGREGGVEVEAADPGSFTRVEVDPLVGLQPFMLRRLARGLNLANEQARAAETLFRTLWEVLLRYDAELVEINPLALTADGMLVAADARMAIDDGALGRQERLPREGRFASEFEQRCWELGVAGVELDGAIAMVISGAGLGMASLDTVTALGGTTRALVDLGGTAFQDRETLEAILRLALDLRPELLMVQAYFQLADLRPLAEALAAVLRERAGDHPPIVARLKGNNQATASAALEPLGVFVTEELETAFRSAVEQASP